MKLKQAQRSQVKLRVGLSGPSGYGKTMSALLLAFGITQDWKKIAVIDTENNSASLYSHLGDFNVLSLEEPFNPQRYIEAIRTCENAGMDVVIVDSISHEWSGKGGCLEMHEKLGGRFQDWARVTPEHNSFIDALLQSKAHIITTARRKVDYSLDRDMNGKTKVMKLGTKEITREGYEYELTVNFELINDNHLVKASKDRTGLFMDKPEFIINQATGKKLKTWCSEGISVEVIKKEIEMCQNLAGLKHIYDKYPSLNKELYPLIIERKNIIEDSNSQVIQENSVEQPKHL
jgi:hypothetical protein